MENLLKQLKNDFPNLSFEEGEVFAWSPKKQQILYPQNLRDRHATKSVWSLLHEVGHALLGHNNYKLDIELVIIETEAWQKAQELADKYALTISRDHIEDCMDTYRDWLHKRSRCPRCNWQNLQIKTGDYRCLNCNTTWTVSSSKLCRPYRRVR